MKKEWVPKFGQWILWLSILVLLFLSGCGGTIGTRDVGFYWPAPGIPEKALS